MKEKINFVSVAISRLSLSYEIETTLEGLSEYLTYDVHVLPREKRLLLEEFEGKVVREFYDSSLCTLFDGQERFLENIHENILENWFGSDGIPKMVMTDDQYEKFLQKFNMYKEEYNDIKISIINGYEQIINSFKEGFKDTFPNAKAITIPSKEEYERSFNMKVYPLKFKITQIDDKRIIQKYNEHLTQKSL